jgi:hypothetical protein
MAQGNAQILREADNQWTLLFFVPAGDGIQDLTSSQVNIATLNAAIDAVKPLASGLPGAIHRVTINVVTREP